MSCSLLSFRKALCSFLLLALLAGIGARAQSVGIGTTTPDNTAVLDLVTPAGVDAGFDKGLLIPRMNSAQRKAIINPAKGLLVFQTDDKNPGFWYNAGTRSSSAWTYLNPTSGSGNNLGNHNAAPALNLGPNALTGAGASIGAAVGMGTRADGGLNLEQNTHDNLFIGYKAGQNSMSSVNQFSGAKSGYSTTTGSKNLFIGFQSGKDNTTGSNNLALGYQAGPTTNNLTNAGTIGYQAQVSQSNSMVLGGTGSNAVSVGIGTTAPSYTLDVNGPIRCAGAVNTSDARLEQNIRPVGPALANMLRLRGVRYTFRRNAFAALNLPAGEQVGVLAQELEKVYPELVSTDNQGYKAVNYAQLTPVLLEAIKEQQQQIETLQKQAVVLSQRAASSEASTLQRVARAEAATTALEQRLQTLEAGGMRADAQR